MTMAGPATRLSTGLADSALENADDDASGVAASGLCAIPVVDTGPDFPLATLKQFKPRTLALLDEASRRYPRQALVALDKISRAWLLRWNNAHLSEIDAVARMLDRPGAHFFSINYEWGCTCRVAPSPDGVSARLIRVLDWMTPGLGKNFVAARVSGNSAGPFAVLTWPGYSGVLQVMAPGRFSAALNQAPMRKSAGLYYMDWLANRRLVWGMPYPTPAHLLRTVAETANDFKAAREMLIEGPVSTPGIYSIAGIKPGETAVIERTERDARVRDGAEVAANHWQSFSAKSHVRGLDSPGRAAMMSAVEPDLDPRFPWLDYPVRNPRTRLVMVADAKAGRLVAQGFEASGAATAPLDLTWDVGRRVA